MNPSLPETITPEQLQALAQRAGLDLTPAELERLRPMYQTLAGQLALLHDPDLPLGLPAAAFRPDAPE